MQASLEAHYQQRLTAARSLQAALARRSVRIGFIRLALVVGLVVIVTLAGTATGWSLGLVGGLWLLMSMLHDRVERRGRRAAAVAASYERGLARLTGRWAGQGRTGERHRPAGHPYADDLDLFGRGGLFELLATMRTGAGEATLARWLLDPAAPSEVAERQEAIRELAQLGDLRERVAVLADGRAADTDADRLGRWATASRRLSGRWPSVLLALLAGVVLVSPIWWLTTWTVPTASARVWLAALVAEVVVVLWFRARVGEATEGVGATTRDLELLSGLLKTIENAAFEATRLNTVQRALRGTDRPASAELSRLGQFVAVLESRANLMYWAVAAELALGTQMAFAIERWRARAGAQVPGWLSAVGEFEALVALGTYAAEHPEYVFAEFGESPAFVEAVGLAHPLVLEGAVANDVRLGEGAPQLLIVSGSNMSGKSTLLRALGINVVLAQAGAPVRARRLRLSPLDVGASIRIVDSLQEGTSRFYAEITRLKEIVAMARARGGGVLFLLDEILAGTNSHDRRLGADGLLSGLTSLGAIGLATTHDLALGQIAERLAPMAANVHFEDVFADGVLSFDYQLRPGVATTSNAIALMRSVGLDV